jgi:hypothetical protein
VTQEKIQWERAEKYFWYAVAHHHSSELRRLGNLISFAEEQKYEAQQELSEIEDILETEGPAGLESCQFRSPEARAELRRIKAGKKKD